MRLRNVTLTSIRITVLTVVGCFSVSLLYAQQPKKDWEGEGEIEDVTIEIVKERQITLPKANRNFDKIPPRASEPIKPPITYDFQSFNFQAPQINTQSQAAQAQGGRTITRIWWFFKSWFWELYVSSS